MAAGPLTKISAAPVRSAPGQFSATLDAMVSSFVALMAGINARIAYMEGLSVSETPAWVSGGSYLIGADVYSEVSWKTYRAKTNHSGEATDPSADAVNWSLSSGLVGSDQDKLDFISVTGPVDLDIAKYKLALEANGSIAAGSVVVLESAGTVAEVTASPTDADDWLGIVDVVVADGEDAPILLKGQVSEDQFGLVVDATYYVDDDGSLTTSSAGGRKIGRALSSTKLLITEGNAQ